MVLPDTKADQVEDLNKQMSAVKVQYSGELGRLQEKQKAAVERAVSRGREGDDTYSPPTSASLHPDLHDLSFGDLGEGQRWVENAEAVVIFTHFLGLHCSHLPPPIRPTSRTDSDEEETYARGTLSDYSDYDSSDEEQHKRQVQQPQASTSFGPQTARRNYISVSEENLDTSRDPRKGLLDDTDDPFADPFADQDEPATPGVQTINELPWQKR
jgi:hypothetical protein